MFRLRCVVFFEQSQHVLFRNVNILTVGDFFEHLEHFSDCVFIQIISLQQSLHNQIGLFLENIAVLGLDAEFYPLFDELKILISLFGY